MSVNVFIWGCIVIALGGYNGFPSFAALRFILGCLESYATPAILLLTSMWYKVEEQPLRIGVCALFSGIAQAVGELLTYGIGDIDGACQS
jgi:MFS family permease